MRALPTHTDAERERQREREREGERGRGPTHLLVQARRTFFTSVPSIRGTHLYPVANSSLAGWLAGWLADLLRCIGRQTRTAVVVGGGALPACSRSARGVGTAAGWPLCFGSPGCRPRMVHARSVAPSPYHELEHQQVWESPVWDAHCRFRESMINLLQQIPGLPPERWGQFSAEVESILRQPAHIFAAFVSASPVATLRPALAEVQNSYRAWQTCKEQHIAGGNCAPQVPRTPPGPGGQDERPLRDEAIALTYAHAVMSRCPPHVYRQFYEILQRYEQQHKQNCVTDSKSRALLDAAQLVDVCEELKQLFGPQHPDLVAAFPHVIPAVLDRNNG